jgi:hypothetical protein
MILGGPAALLILAGSAASKFACWPPVVAAAYRGHVAALHRIVGSTQA